MWLISALACVGDASRGPSEKEPQLHYLGADDEVVQGDPGGTGGDTAPPPEPDLYDPDTFPTFRLALPDDWEDELQGLVADDDCTPRPYLPGDLEFQSPDEGIDDEWLGVGVRYRGHSSLWVPEGSVDNRYGLKLSFDAFAAGREFYDDLQTVNLLGTEGDYTGLREVLSFALLREADVAAPGASFAEVYVNDTHLGVFPDSEEADDGAYVLHHFGVEGGHLYKNSGYCGNNNIAYVGDDPTRYDGFQPQAGTLVEDMTTDLIPLAKCASESDDAAFADCLPQHLDVPGVIRQMAVDALVANYDGLTGANHNYLLWFPPDGSPGVIWPYDYDLSYFDSTSNIGSSSIWSFYPTWMTGPPDLTVRMRRVWSADYCAAILDAAPRHDPAVLLPRIEALRDRLRPEIAADPFYDASKWETTVDELEQVAADRWADVVRQAEDCSP